MRVGPLSVVRSDDVVAEERALVRAVVRGEAAAAEDFHRRAWPIVLRTVRKLLRRGGPDVDDIAMDAVEQVVMAIDSFRSDSSLDRWVSQVTANVVYRTLRRRRLEAKLFLASDDEEEGDGSTAQEVAAPLDLSREASIKQVLQGVREHLGGVSEDKATCFLLHDVHGYSLEEVASIVGVSVAAAQTRVSRGRRELHERIGNDAELAAALQSVLGGSP